MRAKPTKNPHEAALKILSEATREARQQAHQTAGVRRRSLRALARILERLSEARAPCSGCGEWHPPIPDGELEPEAFDLDDYPDLKAYGTHH